MYLFSVVQPSRLRVKRGSSPCSLVWRRDVARTRRRRRLRYSRVRSVLNTYSTICAFEEKSVVRPGENIFDHGLTKIASDGCLRLDYAIEFRAMVVGVDL